jgi:hypothetical protein
MMLPSSPQLAPRGAGASHRVTGAPPWTEIFFSFPSAKNPIQLWSGEKNGPSAFSVPARSVERLSLKDLVANCCIPFVSRVTNAKRL